MISTTTGAWILVGILFILRLHALRQFHQTKQDSLVFYENVVGDVINDKGLTRSNKRIQKQSNNTSWLERVPRVCKIIHHLHIPKTGGSSILHDLETMAKFAQNTSVERMNIYVSRRTNIMKTVVPHLQEEMSKRNYPLLVSLEVGINDLHRHGYPYFNETCFFATVRDPYQWVMSAANHMAQDKHKNGTQIFPHGILAREGFLDLNNIQSKMTLFQSRVTVPSPVCLYTVETVPDLLCQLNSTNSGSICKQMSHQNSGNYTLRASSDLLESVVQERYSDDVNLWLEVLRNNGRLCYGIR